MRAMFDFLKKRKIQKAYNTIAGRDRLIDFSEWEAALGFGNRLLTERMFTLTDTDNSGYIDFDEFYVFANRLLSAEIRDRLTFVYQICDVNNDGRVNRAELNIILTSCLAEQGLELSEDRIGALAESFFVSAHNGAKRYLSQQEFVDFLVSVPDVEYQFDRFIHRLLGIELEHKGSHIQSVGIFKSVYRRTINRWKDIVWFLGYAAVNIALFYSAMATYADQGANLAVQLARGGGLCLNFNGALVLLPLCKTLLTMARHTWLYRILPLDRPGDMHKGIAYAIIFFSGIHVIAHLISHLISNRSIVEELFLTVVGVTGVVLTVVLLVVWWFSSKRRKNYERFVLSHLLYSVFLIALLYHGPRFWIWLMPFLLLFAGDTAYRTFFKRKRVEITELRSLSDRVTRVHFKPSGLFPFYPGDYIKLRIPALSSGEWHPFTLSAAPQANTMDVHVRNNGNWSGALHNLANKLAVKGQVLEAEVDGPYASPSSSMYRSRVAVLVAGGIGVTPFASLLKSVLARRQQLPRGAPVEQIIHFHWLNRSQASYSWFIELLDTAEKQLGERHFKLNIHLTSMARTLSNLVMQIAFDAYWKRLHKDPITDLHARTNAGRPNWDGIFRDIAKQYPEERVDIYFCGPQGLGVAVRKMAFKHGLFYHEEKFE